MITVEPATHEHAVRMAPRMSQKDRDEMVAAGFDPLAAIVFSLDASSVADTALLDGEPIAMWGICPQAVLGLRALMWMLGTPDVQRHPRDLLRMSAYFTEWALDRYPTLDALIDKRHDQALRWVKWLGFTPTGQVVPMVGTEFIGFVRTRG